MFIELAEYLRCPHPHEDAFLVLSTGAMKDRHLVYGTIGCPVCHAEFPVVDGVARFGPAPAVTPPAGPLPDAEVVHALLGLASPGGYVVLVGSPARLAGPLGARLDDVHVICVNPPKPAEVDARSTVLIAPAFVPLRGAVTRGVVVGAEYLSPVWLAEAARVLLHGQRLVALADTVTPPDGVTSVAAGQGMWVGRKTGERP